MNERIKQPHEMYNNKGAYDHKGRWLSYYYQYKRVMSVNAEKVLEVGPGNGTTSTYLRTVGFNVTTADYESALNPDVVADVTKMPFKDKEFDIALCCEVLEHLPYKEFKVALKELTRVSKKVYFSVPDQRKVLFSCSIKLPFLNFITISIRVPRYFTTHKFDGFHYWEIGKKDFSVKKVLADIKSADINVIEHGSPQDVPLIHYFFIESKN